MQKNILFPAAYLSRNIIRSYARRGTLKNANPGIQKRLNILEEREDEILENIDLEEMESDFMNVEEAHRKHEKELKYSREKEKYWIVKQKYFKENKINFLTWDDKEQIRYLHQTNPTEWTVEKLSEGFPALPEAIKKIVKNKWQIQNDSKKRNHDAAVDRNWKLLKEGKLTDVLQPNVLNHLLKFSSRKQKVNLDDSTLTNNITVVNNSKAQKSNSEFASIINSYEKIKLRNEVKTEQNDVQEYCKITNVIESKLKSYGKKDVTLNMITENHVHKDKSEIIQGSETNLLESIFQKNKNNDLNKLPQKFSNTGSNVSVGLASENNVIQGVSYPEKINIPKNKFKKGYTYKVNDCYYDDDGEFLYRVPGMY